MKKEKRLNKDEMATTTITLNPAQFPEAKECGEICTGELTPEAQSVLDAARLKEIQAHAKEGREQENNGCGKAYAEDWFIFEDVELILAEIDRLLAANEHLRAERVVKNNAPEAPEAAPMP